MLKYLADVILLVIICSIPYLVLRLRLHSSRSRKATYDSVRYTTGMPKDRV
jgi:hypothetical protein